MRGTVLAWSVVETHSASSDLLSIHRVCWLEALRLILHQKQVTPLSVIR